MDTTRDTNAWWWVLGAIVVILLIWWAVASNNNNAGIPNTGVDTASSSDLMNNGSTNPDSTATSTGNPTIDNAKG